MKALVLASDVHTHGGMARYTWTLASTLGDLIGPDNVHVLAVLNHGGPKDDPKGFRILGVVANRLTPTAKLRFATKAFAHARQKYDQIICSHVSLAPIAALARAAFGTPFWVACHDTEVWERMPALRLAAMRRAELALPVSQFTAEKLHDVNGIPRDKMRVLRNAIEDEFVTLLLSGDGRPDSVTRLVGGDRYILSIGNLAKFQSYKGFDNVIRALPRLLAEIPDLHYVIVGTGDDRPRLEVLASEIGVRGRVVFAGRVNDEQLAEYYRGCEAFVMPSRVAKHNGRLRGEGFGRVYVEAALAGKPVVGSRDGGAAEAVVHGKTGLLVDPTSVPEISAALLTLLRNAELSQGMGSEGRRWAERHFTQAAMRTALSGMLWPSARRALPVLPGLRAQKQGDS